MIEFYFTSSSSSSSELSVSSLNQGQDQIKVFQIKDFVTSVGLLGIRLVFNLKNIIASTSMGLRDDRLGAMTSLIPPRLHSNSS